MFTGIVTELGRVASVRRTAGGASLGINAPLAASTAEIGDSIAINGACLTVVARQSDGTMSFDVSGESLKATTLGDLKSGDRVNIEPALRAGGKLGGHMVTGHVDAVGTITGRQTEGEAVRYTIAAPAEVLKYLVPKGSVTLDGISLTVVDVMEGAFTLVIIPHTLEVTTLGSKGPGGRVNLEADIIGKYVHRYLSDRAGGDASLMAALKRGGFM